MQKRAYKLSKQSVDERDHIHTVDLSVPIPSVVDLTPELPAVLDQGNLGSCGVNATATCLRHLLHKEGHPDWAPSRLFMYFNTRVNIEGSPASEDTGVTIRDVCKSLTKYKVCSETSWPYNIPKFSIKPPPPVYAAAGTHPTVHYAAVAQDLQTLKATIASKTPVIFGIQVYSSFESQTVMETGVVPLPDVNNEQCLGGHALLLIGYSDADQTFRIRNSWGTSVGLPSSPGNFDMPYAYVLDPNLASDFWAIKLF